jgi:hypothetical protein
MIRKIAAIVISAAFTGVAANYVFQAIFSVPLLKSIVAISSTITIVILEIISILWLFKHVQYKQKMYNRNLGHLSAGDRPLLGGRSLARTVSASAYASQGSSGFGLFVMVAGALLCSALFVASHHFQSAPWFVFGGIRFGQAEALALSASALALLIASYFGPLVALGIGLSCLGADYLDSINFFYHANLSLPGAGHLYLGYATIAFSWPASVGLILRSFVAGLAFPRSRGRFRAAVWLTFAVIVLVNVGLVYLQMRTHSLSQSEVARSLFTLTLFRLVDLFLVIVAHWIIP